MSATPAKASAPAQGWWVYILRCGDGSLYTGCTNDLERRVARHAAGKGAAYTRSRLPVRVVFQEPAADRSAALRREAAIKRLTRTEKLAMLPKRAPAKPKVAKREPARLKPLNPAAEKRGSRGTKLLKRAAAKRGSAGPKLLKPVAAKRDPAKPAGPMRKSRALSARQTSA